MLIVCAGAGTAAAQDTVPGPPAGQDPLAGTPVAPPPPKPLGVVKRLDFGIGLYEGYDVTLATDTRPGLTYDPRFRQDTSFSSANGSLTFARVSRNLSLGLNGAGTLRYYTVAPDVLPVDYSGGFNLSARLTRRTRMRVSTSASFSPDYSFNNLFAPISAGLPVVNNPDQNVARLNTITSNTSAGWAWAVSNKTAVDAGYSLDFVDTSSGAYETMTQGGNVSWSRRTTRYSTLHLGYAYRQSEFGPAQTLLHVHDIQAGFGYQRPLSFSRHTVVGFNVGSSLIQDGGFSTFAITGNASLSHQLSRRWGSSLSYYRDISTFAGSSQAFLSDSLSGALSGLLARKISATFSGGYSRGHAATGFDNGYASSNAGARVQLPGRPARADLHRVRLLSL